MTTTDAYAGFGTKQTPQSEAAPNHDQIKNKAGGFVFKIDPLTQLRRFLTIGSETATYSVGAKELTKENGLLILAMTKDAENHKILVDEIVEISLAGRALKQQPILFALAIACQHGPTESKQYARAQITKVVRTGTHLFTFVKYLGQFGGWSRGLRKAVGSWYVEKDAEQLAYQLVKYRQREGYTHRDVLRLTHPMLHGPTKRGVINWAVKGSYGDPSDPILPPMPRVLKGHIAANDPGNESDISDILTYTNLPWEALPDSAMNDVKVWDKMLDNGVPVGAMLRQLPRLTQLGMLPDMMGEKGRTKDVVDILLNEEALKKARIHPIQVLLALKTYQQGHGIRSTWAPSRKIVDALDEMFYLTFDNIEPTGKRTLLAHDVSASMWWENSAGKLPMYAGEIAAAMSMVTMRSEEEWAVVAFNGHRNYSGDDPVGLLPMDVSPRQRLDDVIRTFRNMPHGGTDASLPMLWAAKHNVPVDTFVIYTDNDTWAGSIHPFQALEQYRQKMGIPARMAVVATQATNYSIANPKDPGMLDVSGFDASVPQLLSDFSAGRI